MTRVKYVPLFILFVLTPIELIARTGNEVPRHANRRAACKVKMVCAERARLRGERTRCNAEMEFHNPNSGEFTYSCRFVYGVEFGGGSLEVGDETKFSEYLGSFGRFNKPCTHGDYDGNGIVIVREKETGKVACWSTEYRYKAR